MNNAIKFARSVKGIVIQEADEEMILHCRRSFLFWEKQPWTKIGPENFDVPMGSYDGAEICELVGLYILHKLTSGKDPIFEKENCGIYRDHGLAIIKINGSRRIAENDINKKLREIFGSENLKITIDPLAPVTNYLDVFFNLKKHVHEPYRKPTNDPVYINVNSDHPKHVIKHIPTMIEQRLSTLSSTENIFDTHKAPYEKALKDSGYIYRPIKDEKDPRKIKKAVNLKYQKPKKSRRKRKPRKIIYFNPPFSKSVKTNVIKLFLGMIDKHFPKGHKLHKCFNRNTVKATYCTLSNMMDKIGNHNGKVLKKESEQRVEIVNGVPEKCCRDQFNCPLMPDRCDQKNVIYQADVRTVNSVMSYYGLTENEFKKRCSTHRSSFRNIPKRHTTLSSYIWKLKDKRTPHYVNWSIKARGHPFSSGGRACDLCLTEKLVILTADPNQMLNKRDELLETCRHRRKHLLVSLFKPPEEDEPPDTTIK